VLKTGSALSVYWLFDEENAMFSREPAEEMLGALVDEAPSQVRKADEVFRHNG
jgi:hypothetical protein